jgi:HD superfamily phosphohydrolase
MVYVMLIRDALYGAFEIPSFLDRLVLSPEFRRLSEIRLININSVSLAALADVRRYSHTLGVLRLALLNPLIGLGEDELRAFLASIIIHDAGTPAFAHLFEYFLSERFQWNHELVLSHLLTGRHHVDQSAQQIYSSQSLAFEKICKEERIDFDLILTFVQRTHPYSKLIFGSIDFDNLDNVARMNWMLGQRFDLSSILSIARNIGIGPDNRVQLPKSEAANVSTWQALRAAAYGILVFDEATVAGQAVLSKAIAEALDAGSLNSGDWTYNDRTLIDALEKTPSIKKRLHNDMIKELPRLCLLHIEQNNLDRLDEVGRPRLIELIEEFLRGRFASVRRTYGYVFRDRGTFSKSVEFVDPASSQTWCAGTRSGSVIFYGFAKGHLLREVNAKDVGADFRLWIDTRLGND